jgi:hypothetical protein
VAPALHSLIILWRDDAVHILRTLFNSHDDLRKLILNDCNLGVNSTGILLDIVLLYPDLEALSLACCRSITSDALFLIPCLKKLCELNLSFLHVSYLYVKLLHM